MGGRGRVVASKGLSMFPALGELRPEPLDDKNQLENHRIVVKRRQRGLEDLS